MALMKSKPGSTTAPAAGSTLSGAKGKIEEAPEANAAPAAAAAAAAAPAAAAAAAAAPAAAASAAAAAAPSEQTAVAVAARGAVAVAGNAQMVDHIETFKDRYTVDWNTLIRLQASNGQFIVKDDKDASLGDTIQMQLLSYQDSWQVSPGSDSDEAKALVRYSNDGKTTTQGEDIGDHLAKCREMGYTKAKLDFRVMVVGVLMGSTKDNAKAQGELCQIDLSATSRQEFDRFRLGSAFKLGRGLLTPQNVEIMTMTAEIASGKGKTWTKVIFSPTMFEGAAA